MERKERTEAVRAATALLGAKPSVTELLALAEHISRYIASGKFPEEKGDELTYC